MEVLDREANGLHGRGGMYLNAIPPMTVCQGIVAQFFEGCERTISNWDKAYGDEE